MSNVPIRETFESLYAGKARGTSANRNKPEHLY